MDYNSIETALMEPEEKELVEYIFRVIPDQDRGELTGDDILLVLDLMDDYLEDGIITARWMRPRSWTTFLPP